MIIKKYLSKIKYHKFLCFYTIWALFLHFLYYKGYIGNTFPIALFVLICSQIIAYINPKYPYFVPFEFLLHFLPVILIPVSFENTDYLVLSFLLYIILINKNSIKLYTDPISFLIK
jgi:hypothetical protein